MGSLTGVSWWDQLVKFACLEKGLLGDCRHGRILLVVPPGEEKLHHFVLSYDWICEHMWLVLGR